MRRARESEFLDFRKVHFALSDDHRYRSSNVRYADDRIGYDSIKYVLSSGHVGYWSGYVRRVGPVDTLTSGDDGIRCARFRHQGGEAMLQGMCVCRRDAKGGVARGGVE